MNHAWRFFRRSAVSALVVAALVPRASVATAATLYGMVNTGELYVSTDAGATWSIRSTLPIRDAVALVAGASGGELLLAGESGAVYRSVDGGASWTAVGAAAAGDVAALLRPGDVLLLTRSGSVLASTDGGATFTGAGAIVAGGVTSAASIGDARFALTRTGELHRSSDGGASWSAIAVVPIDEAVGLVALAGRLYALSATGEVAMAHPPWDQWSVVSTLSQVGMTALLAAGGELLASTTAGEIAASADGIAWSWRGAIGQLTVRGLGSDVPATNDVPDGSHPRIDFAPPWPNPTHALVQFSLELPRPMEVSVDVFDASGRWVARPLGRQLLPAGRSRHAWDPGPLPSGTYFVRARGPFGTASRRVVVLATR